MVAYSFNRQFYDAVSSRVKRQTVRANRKRHARAGEAVQLYAAMRTKHCRKIVDDDPICISVDLVEIGVSADVLQRLAWVAINGVRLSDQDIETFAVADGFRSTSGATARQRMGRFWSTAHGTGVFEGVLIKWDWPA
jgi:hypothetical protein